MGKTIKEGKKNLNLIIFYFNVHFIKEHSLSSIFANYKEQFLLYIF